jgi:hypothetical protein
MLLNAHYEEIDFTLAALKGAAGWRLTVDTARGLIEPDEPLLEPGLSMMLPARTLLLYRAER